MRASELKGRKVITTERPEKVGAVNNVILDPNGRLIAGLKVSPGAFTADQLVRAQDISLIGPDAITIRDTSVLGTPETYTQLGQLPDLGDLARAKVVSASGEDIGDIADVMIDPNRLTIVGYVLSSGFWSQLTRNEKVIDATDNMRYGKGILMVPNDVASTLLGRQVGPTTEAYPEEERPEVPYREETKPPDEYPPAS